MNRVLLTFSLSPSDGERVGVRGLLHFRFPPFAVGAAPESGRALVAHNFVLFAIEVDGMTRAPRDISEMTEQRALLPIFNLRLQIFSGTYRLDEIAEMQNIVVLAFDL